MPYLEHHDVGAYADHLRGEHQVGNGHLHPVDVRFILLPFLSNSSHYVQMCSFLSLRTDGDFAKIVKPVSTYPLTGLSAMAYYYQVGLSAHIYLNVSGR